MLRRDIEALRINNEGLTKTFAIYDEADQQAVVKAAMRRIGFDDKQLNPRVVLAEISWAKNHMIDPQEYFLSSADPTGEKIAHIFETYKKELLKANALDFDDLLLEDRPPAQILREVRQRYNRRYRYLLIDEYQDTNRPQYELMKLLAGKRKTSASSATRTRASIPGAEPTSEHPRIREGLPRRKDHPPRAELPLHPDHPRSRLSRGRAQHPAQRQNPLDIA